MQIKLSTYFDEQNSNLRALLARPIASGYIGLSDLLPLEQEFGKLTRMLIDFNKMASAHNPENPKEKDSLNRFRRTLSVVMFVVDQMLNKSFEYENSHRLRII
jgi:hypothetical protein